MAQKEHVASFAYHEDTLDRSVCSVFLNLLADGVSGWEEVKVPGCKKPLLVGLLKDTTLLVTDASKETKLEDCFAALQKAAFKPEVKEVPGSIIRQQMLIDDLQEQLEESPVTKAGEQEQVVRALKYAAEQRDPMAFIRGSETAAEEKETFAWRMFQNVLVILQDYGALNGTTATDLGQMVGSLSADNELWLALILQMDELRALTAS
eukprot:gene18996-24026_t